MLRTREGYAYQLMTRADEEKLALRWSRLAPAKAKVLINRGLARAIRSRATPAIAAAFNEAVRVVRENDGKVGWYVKAQCQRVVDAAVSDAGNINPDWWFGRVAGWQPGYVRAYADYGALTTMCFEYIKAGLSSPAQS